MVNLLRKLVSFLLVFSFIFVALPARVFAEGPSVSTKSAILIQADTGEILYAKNEKEKLPMASTTKIMTALLTLEEAQINNRTITITDEMVRVEGSSMGLLPGYQLTLRDLAIGMLTV